jgi:hypothetical protein
VLSTHRTLTRLWFTCRQGENAPVVADHNAPCIKPWLGHLSVIRPERGGTNFVIDFMAPALKGIAANDDMAGADFSRFGAAAHWLCAEYALPLTLNRPVFVRRAAADARLDHLIDKIMLPVRRSFDIEQPNLVLSIVHRSPLGRHELPPDGRTMIRPIEAPPED